MKVSNRVAFHGLRRSINIKGMSCLWYAKEAAWTVAFWVILFGLGILVTVKVAMFIMMFGTLVASVWVRAACTNDDRLAAMAMPRLLRHAVLIAMLATVMAWVLARFV